jgi:hypothetical protein
MKLALVTAAALASMIFAASAPARPATVPYQIDVTVTDTSCTLDHASSPQLLVLFHVISRGKYSHQFKIWGVSSGIIKTGQDGIFKVKFRSRGAYGYTCYNSHAVLKRGSLRIR